MKPVASLPSSHDWRDFKNVVSPVKDQGHCGSCWAFSSTAVLESHIARATGLLFDLSVQQVSVFQYFIELFDLKTNINLLYLLF